MSLVDTFALYRFLSNQLIICFLPSESAKEHNSPCNLSSSLSYFDNLSILMKMPLTLLLHCRNLSLILIPNSDPHPPDPTEISSATPTSRSSGQSKMRYVERKPLF